MDAIQYLLSIETRGIKLGIERTREIMAACGDPQLGLSAIQVAGTNGKGSVSAMLSNILKIGGYKTGLFTSPHLVCVNERIRINGAPIPDEEIDLFIGTYKSEIERIEATFFETITALALWYFKKERVEIAVLETGLGGRLDSVTICEPVATVITPISLDHMEILGETLAEIALEKAGAMKKNVLCISARQELEVKNVLEKEAAKNGVPIRLLNGESKIIHGVNIPGNQQKENALLAVSTLESLPKLKISSETMRRGLDTVHWSGRNQWIQEKPMVIFDVAHNLESISAFLDYYQSLNIKANSILIISLQRRKRIRPLIPRLQSVFHYIICTEAGDRHPMSAEELNNFFDGADHTEIITDPVSAIQSGLKRVPPDGGLAIIGTHCLGPSVSSVFKISFD